MNCLSPGCKHTATVIIEGPTPEGGREEWPVCAAHEFELAQEPVSAFVRRILPEMGGEYHTQRFMLYQDIHERLARPDFDSTIGVPVTPELCPPGSTLH